MSLDLKLLGSLIFGDRFTQNSPVVPEVWFLYNKDPRYPIDLLLTPDDRSSASELSKGLQERLQKLRGYQHSTSNLTYNESSVVVRLTFTELILAALPLTEWWAKDVWPEPTRFETQRSPQLRGGDLDDLKSRFARLQTVGDELSILLDIREPSNEGIGQEGPPSPSPSIPQTIFCG